MNKFSLILAIIITISCFPVLAAEDQVGATKDYGFPLTPGMQWQYNYVSEDQDPNGKDFVEPYTTHDGTKVPVNRVKATLKLEVQSVTITEAGVLAKIVGNSLLPWPNPVSTKDYYFGVQDSTGKFYSGTTSLVNAFNSNNFDGVENDMIMILPPDITQHWGGISTVYRNDTWYRWQVETEEKITVPAGTFKCFRIAFRTCPDHQVIWYSPKVGIVKTESMHHGTVMNTFVELASYGIKK